jgi:hypothetical protein
MCFVDIPKKIFLWLELYVCLERLGSAKQGLGQGAGLERKVVVEVVV